MTANNTPDIRYSTESGTAINDNNQSQRPTSTRKGFYCRKTTTKEKCIAIVILIVIVGIVTVLVTISTRNTGLSTDERFHDFYDDEICTTETCKATADLVKSNIDPSVDPCMDFYDYACGGWAKNNPRPEDELVEDGFTHARGEVQKSLIALLENESRGLKESKATFNVRKLFRSCMNDEMREKEGVQYFVQLLTELGGWPLLGADQWDRQGYVWYHHLAAVNRRLNLGIIIHLLTSAINTTTLTLRKPSFVFDQFVLGNSRTSESCIQYIMQYARLLGSTLDDDQLYESAARVVKLEYDLETFAMLRITMLGTVQKLNSLTKDRGSFSWKEYLNLMLRSKIPVEDETNLVVNDDYYIKNIPAIINNTEKSTVANYIGTLIVHSLAKYSTPELRRLYYNFTSTKPEAKKSCYEDTCNLMNSACGRLFVGQNFSHNMRTDVTEMVEMFRRTYKSTLEQNTWMDNYSKTAALKKLRKMDVYVGYNDWIMDNELLDGHYEPAGDIREKTFFESAVRLTTLVSNDMLSIWGKKAQSYRGIKNPLDTNAYYRLEQNSVEMSAAFLQFPFYKYSRIQAINYGSLGFIIGHEIGHAFDETGSNFDSEGKSKYLMWGETRKTFQEKVYCFIRQYSSLVEPVTNTTVNGRNTVAENMADNAALNSAFKAFRLSLSTSSVNPRNRLVGVSYSPEQLFFLGFASAWCKNATKSHLSKELRRDAHSPNKFRVNIPASNFIEFARAFNCSLGTPMNPDHKCSLW